MFLSKFTFMSIGAEEMKLSRNRIVSSRFIPKNKLTRITSRYIPEPVEKCFYHLDNGFSFLGSFFWVGAVSSWAFI